MIRVASLYLPQLPIERLRRLERPAWQPETGKPLSLSAPAYCGDDDPGTPPDRNKLIASKIHGGRYEGIANARHLPNVERPDQFNRLMMSWLANNR